MMRLPVGSPWPASRQVVAVGAATAAFLTALLALAVAPERRLALAAGIVYVGLTVAATKTPALVAEQTVAGAAVAVTTLVGADTVAVGVVPIVAGVVLASELLGLAGQLAIVVPRRSEPGVRRALTAAVGAAMLSGAVVGAGSLPGPTGLLATVAAATGVIAAAQLMRAY